MPNTFIVDCPFCKAKVAAIEAGRAEQFHMDEDSSPYGERLSVGSCPRCLTLLAAESQQTRFENIDSDEDEWSDFIRVFPAPAKIFSSYRIPKIALNSLGEADRALQANAHVAACVMFGRALEAVCRDLLREKDEFGKSIKIDGEKKIMLASGIQQLKEKNIIDARLLDWSQQLHYFRNLAAHPDEEITISREEVEDLQAFAYAITEYVYDLTERYNEFKARAEHKKRPQPSAATMFASVLKDTK